LFTNKQTRNKCAFLVLYKLISVDSEKMRYAQIVMGPAGSGKVIEYSAFSQGSSSVLYIHTTD